MKILRLAVACLARVCAGRQANFTGNDANGRTIDGVQLGVLHRF